MWFIRVLFYFVIIGLFSVLGFAIGTSYSADEFTKEVGLVLSAIGIVISFFRLLSGKSKRALRPDFFPKSIAVAFYGMGGSGKTSLINSGFFNRMGTPEITRGSKTYRIRKNMKFGNRNRRRRVNIDIVDVEGQQEHLTRLHTIDDLDQKMVDASFLIMVLSPFLRKDDFDYSDINESDRKRLNVLDLPHSKTNQSVSIRMIADEHDRLYNQPVIGDLVTRLPKLRCIFIVINQIDLVAGKTDSEKIQLLREIFSPTIDRIESYVSSHVEKTGKVSKNVEVIYTNASKGIEYVQSRNRVERKKLDLSERISDVISQRALELERMIYNERN